MDGQVISAGELVVKAQYISSMQEKTNWYQKQQPLQQTIIVPTCTILHPHLDVITIRYVQEIPRKFCNTVQEKNPYKELHICMTDANYDSILDEIVCCEKKILNGM